MSQMNEYNKTSEKELNKIETSNLLDAEFKTLVITMLNELRGRVDALSENFNKEMRNRTELENIKNQSEMKNTLSEKNTLQGTNSGVVSEADQ